MFAKSRLNKFFKSLASIAISEPNASTRSLELSERSRFNGAFTEEGTCIRPEPLPRKFKRTRPCTRSDIPTCGDRVRSHKQHREPNLRIFNPSNASFLPYVFVHAMRQVTYVAATTSCTSLVTGAFRKVHES
jgi:hypothetical protein